MGHGYLAVLSDLAYIDSGLCKADREGGLADARRVLALPRHALNIVRTGDCPRWLTVQCTVLCGSRFGYDIP